MLFQACCITWDFGEYYMFYDKEIVFWSSLFNLTSSLYWHICRDLEWNALKDFCIELLNVIFSCLAVSLKHNFCNAFGQALNNCTTWSCYLFLLPTCYLNRQMLLSVLHTVLYRNKFSGLKQFFIMSGLQKWPSLSRKRVKDFPCVDLQS